MTVVRAIWRLLTFRMSVDEFTSLDRRHLIAGLVLTWVVGMGRWWDDSDAHLVQHLGLGSVIYAFVLAGLIWIVVLPLRPQNWGYGRVLTFVSLTSPPGLVYAIPVERFLDRATAGEVNLLFLAVVALWRVALLMTFLLTVPGLGTLKGVVSALLPMSAIVSSLAALNLHRAVFEIMGGIEESRRTAHDRAYFVLLLLTYLAVRALPVLLLLYIGAIVHSRVRAKT